MYFWLCHSFASGDFCSDTKSSGGERNYVAPNISFQKTVGVQRRSQQKVAQQNLSVLLFHVFVKYLAFEAWGCLVNYYSW